MKQITYRMLQQSAKWMKDLPVELTRYGKVVAIISSPEKILENISPPDKPETLYIKVEPPLPHAEIKPEIVDQVDPEDSLDIGRCVIPNCALKGPMRYDWMAYNENIGEMAKAPSYACKKHYLGFLKIKDAL